MALDGCRYLLGPYYRPSSESDEHMHASPEAEAVEEDMVVLFYARPFDRLGHATADPHKG